MSEYGIKSLGELVDRLAIINARIFALESEIGGHGTGELKISDAEAGRRTKQIRILNAERVECVNAINERHGDIYRDIKVQHGSERKS